MTKILVILVTVTLLAYLSQQQSLKYTQGDGRKHWDIYLIILFIFLVLLAGLRTSYNDTVAYAAGYNQSVTITEFFKDSTNLELLHNPLFYGFQALVKTFTNNVNVFFMICAVIVNYFNIKFIKRTVDVQDFAFSMFLYVSLGTFMLSLGAQKQTLAMSVITVAITQLFDKKYVKYYIIVFLAGLIHSYAWLFLFLPLLDCKPWSLRTYILLFSTMFVMYTFQSTISSLIEVADQVGKNISVKEVFDGNQMNIFRVLVYSVVPMIALIFKDRINSNIDRKHSILIQMSTVSLMFMMMGTMNGANMFGRSGNYFEIGYICSLVWIVRKLFTKQSVSIVLIIATICFAGFYMYDNQTFQYEYRNKSITRFIAEVVRSDS